MKSASERILDAIFALRKALFGSTTKKVNPAPEISRKKTLFIGNLFPYNTQHLWDAVIKNAAEMGGVLVLNKESAVAVSSYLRHQGTFDFANRMEIINLSSIENIEQLNAEIEPLLSVDSKHGNQAKLTANKLVVIFVHDDVEKQHDYLKCILGNIKNFVHELFDTELTWRNNEVKLPVLLENYNLYQLHGFSLIGAQARSLGIDFHFSANDLDHTTNTDEFKSLIANSDLIAVYGFSYRASTVRII